MLIANVRLLDTDRSLPTEGESQSAYFNVHKARVLFELADLSTLVSAAVRSIRRTQLGVRRTKTNHVRQTSDKSTTNGSFNSQNVKLLAIALRSFALLNARLVSGVIYPLRIFLSYTCVR